MRFILGLVSLLACLVCNDSWARPLYVADAVRSMVPTVKVHEEVLVRVRAVQAEHAIPTSQISRHHVATVAEELSDISKKLSRLPFDSFKLLTAKTMQVKFNKQAEMELVDGHKLKFKPLQERDKRVCLWFEWSHGGEMEVLNTRLHFNYGESMLTGMESANDTGIILAVDVQPVE